MTNFPLAETVPTGAPIKDQRVVTPEAFPKESATPLSAISHDVEQLPTDIVATANNLNDVPISSMSENVKGQYENLCNRKNPDGTDMTEEQFEKSARAFIKSVKSPQSSLNEKQKDSVESLDKMFSTEQEQVAKKDAVKALEQFANDPNNSPEDIRLANEALQDLNKEIENPSEEHSYKIKESLGKLFKIFKVLGAALVALLTMGMFKAMKVGK